MLFTREFKREVEIAFVLGGIESAVDLIYNKSKSEGLRSTCEDFKKQLSEGRKKQALETGFCIVKKAGLQENDMYNLTKLKKYRKKLVTPDFVAEVKRLSHIGKPEVVKYIDTVFTRDAGIRKITTKYLDIYEFGDPQEAERLYKGLLACLGISKAVNKGE